MSPPNSTNPKVSLLKQAWERGGVSRLTMVFGLFVSAGWAILVAARTVRFIVDTVERPGLALAYKMPVLVVVVFVVLLLVIHLPTQWLMYVLHRLDERRRRSGFGRRQ